VGTHPLFGPQSAANGIHGLQIAICPVRGPHLRIAALCRS
jgi:prephenate dehydrogenase